MDSFVSNIFVDGKECSKEDTIVDWNSPPILDKYHSEDCELGRSSQVVGDFYETFFVQIQITVDFTGDLFRGKINSSSHRRIGCKDCIS